MKDHGKNSKKGNLELQRIRVLETMIIESLKGKGELWRWEKNLKSKILFTNLTFSINSKEITSIVFSPQDPLFQLMAVS